MPPSFRYGQDALTAGHALAIARGSLPAVVTPAARGRVAAAYRRVMDASEGGAAVYGINTGFGPLCNTRIGPADTVALQRNLLLSHAVGMGAPLDAELVRLMLVLKTHALCRGHSGIAPYVIDRIRWHLEHDVLPVVPEQGSVGASGDLAPLAHLFLPLIGAGEVDYQGRRRPAGEVLATFGLAPLALHPKAGLALINGTQFMLAHAVRLVDELGALLDHADLIAALTTEGLLGSRMPFHPALHATRPHPGVAYVAARLWHFTAGSAINASHADCDRVQDPYSVRCAPQVHGASRQAWAHLRAVIGTELNAVTDNPVLVADDLIISGGSFHGQPIALPMDYACLAAHEVGSISERRAYLALHGVADKVPRLLVADTGLHSGLMIVQYTAAALVSENKSLCFPAAADSIPTSLGQEDHVSMGSISGRKALRVCANLRRILAVELVCAAQALDFHRPLRTSAVLEAVHALVRQRIAHATDDRPYGNDLRAAADLIGSRALLAVAAAHRPPVFTPDEATFQLASV